MTIGTKVATGLTHEASNGSVSTRDVVQLTGSIICRVIGGIVGSVTVSPELGAMTDGVGGSWAGGKIGEELHDSIAELIDDITSLNDPDGGYNSHGLMGPGYNGYGQKLPQDVLRDMQRSFGLEGFGSGLPVGHEFNALDLLAQQRQGYNGGGDAGGDGGTSTGGLSTSPETGHGTSFGGGNGPSRGGTGDDTSPNPSPGYSSRGLNDLEGPEAVGPGSYNGGADNFGNDRSNQNGTQDQDFDPEEGTPEISHGLYSPILLDLDGTGVTITELSHSQTYIDAGGDGLQHRTAWAGAGDGVLYIEDDDGEAGITDKREYVFTEWDPTAKDDMAALRAVFDSNGDGKLTSADTRFADFRVMVTKADGATGIKTLAQLGITEIGLMADTTRIELADGSVITGQSTFKIGGQTRTVANTTLVAEADGHRVETVESTSGGIRRHHRYAEAGASQGAEQSRGSPVPR